MSTCRTLCLVAPRQSQRFAGKTHDEAVLEIDLEQVPGRVVAALKAIEGAAAKLHRVRRPRTLGNG